jgi:hypothetical protein
MLANSLFFFLQGREGRENQIIFDSLFEIVRAKYLTNS